MNTRNIGLVLDGGGGKGAYQLGVWKALNETGLSERIAQVSGASVGGLNAALMVKGDYDLAERIWLQEIKSLKPTRIHMWVESIVKQYLGDCSFFETSPIECWLATKCITPGISSIPSIVPVGELAEMYQCGKAHYFNMRGCSENQRQKLLTEDVLNTKIMLATCALPLLCSSKKINGLRYRDGGLVDNSPLRPLTDVPKLCSRIPKLDWIIVIHLDPFRGDYDPVQHTGTRVLQITPSAEMGGFFTGTVNFKAENAERLWQAGYQESLSLFKGFVENEKKENLDIWIAQQEAELNAEQRRRAVESLARIKKWKAKRGKDT